LVEETYDLNPRLLLKPEKVQFDKTRRPHVFHKGQLGESGSVT